MNTKRPFRYDTEAYLQQDIAYWKKILGLHDWKITGKLVSEHVMPHAYGQTITYKDRLAATILIREASSLTEDDVFENDHELTLIHELLHVLFWWEPNESPEKVVDHLWEQTLDKLATAFAKFRRMSPQPEHSTSNAPSEFMPDWWHDELKSRIIKEGIE